MYAAIVVRAYVVGVAAAAAMTGCFRGGFLDDADGPMPPLPGVFISLNFTAKKIDFYAPA